MRSTEIRIDRIELDPAAKAFLDEVDAEGEIRIVTNRRETGDVTEYRFKEHEKRVDNLLREVRPQIYAKGGDYTVNSLDPDEVAALKEIGARIEILPLVPGKSTSKLIQAIQRK